jgi:hypothetical protein
MCWKFGAATYTVWYMMQICSKVGFEVACTWRFICGRENFHSVAEATLQQ